MPFRFVLSCDISSYFSPSPELLEAILSHIDQASKSIDVCIYTFTNRKLAYALVNAQDRGINIRIIMDERSDRNTQWTKSGFLRTNGIDVKIISGIRAERENEWDGLMHHKFAIIDDNILINGSANWTASAIQRNYENILIIKDCPHIISAFSDEFNKLWKLE